MSPAFYTLLIALGQSPQVLTETVWSLARQHRPSLLPEAVHVVTTATGAAHLQARLLGDPQFDPVLGTPIPHVEDRWTPFCRHTLGLPEAVPLHVHVPETLGMPHTDVLSPTDDAAFADLCYQLTAQLTAEGNAPVVGSIAGGRKTMSAHLMTAFCVFARPEDRLTHVLVSPDPLPSELGDTFFHPAEETAGLVRLHRVDVEFPRLQSVLRRLDLHLPDGRSDLRSLLGALEPHAMREQKPGSFEVRLGDRNAVLGAYTASGDLLDACELTATEAAILLVIANAMETGDGEARAVDLYEAGNGLSAAIMHPVHRQRELIEGYCNVLGESSVAWQSNKDVSQAISRVTRKLAQVPILERYLAFESRGRTESLTYYWPEPLPGPIRVSSDAPLPRWTLQHIEVVS